MHFDAHPVIGGDRAVQFLSALIGVWPNTTIYMPGKEDVPIEVGTVVAARRSAVKSLRGSCDRRSTFVDERRAAETELEVEPEEF